MLKKTNTYLIYLITICYVFRGVTTRLDIGGVVYILSFISIILSVLSLSGMVNKLKYKIINRVDVFIIFGIIALVFSFIITNIIVSVLGFVAFFFNLICIYLYFLQLEENERDIFVNKYITLNITIGCISAVAGIYQFYFDSSLFGFATHAIYSNEELLKTGTYVRRATAFMGGPQNYSLYMSLVLIMTFRDKKIRTIFKPLIIFILLWAGFVSGSRSFSVSTALGFLGYALAIGCKKYGAKVFPICSATIIFAGIGFLVIRNIFFMNNITFSRVFDFFSNWPALSVYIENINTMTISNIFFGKGLGVGERLVSEYLGAQYYVAEFGTTYASYESYFLSLFMQSGIFGILLFTRLLAKALSNAVINNDYIIFALLIGLTVNMLFTPSFNGLAMSFIFYPFILMPIMQKKSTRPNACVESNS